MLLLLFMAAIYLVAALCEVLFFLENCLAFGLSFEGLHSSSNIDNYFTLNAAPDYHDQIWGVVKIGKEP